MTLPSAPTPQDAAPTCMSPTWWPAARQARQGTVASSRVGPRGKRHREDHGHHEKCRKPRSLTMPSSRNEQTHLLAVPLPNGPIYSQSPYSTHTYIYIGITSNRMAGVISFTIRDMHAPHFSPIPRIQVDQPQLIYGPHDDRCRFQAGGVERKVLRTQRY